MLDGVTFAEGFAPDSQVFWLAVQAYRDEAGAIQFRLPDGVRYHFETYRRGDMVINAYTQVDKTA